MSKISRNDLCWCGSQQKYKKCHLPQDEKLNHLSQLGYPVPSQDIIKSKEQIEGIRKSCNLTKSILDDLTTFIKPGLTTNQINDWVHNKIIAANAIPAPLNYRGFPKSICASLSNVICHGIPDDRVLIDGDTLNVDITCILEGYYGDSCRMYTIGAISKEEKRLISVTKECLEAGIKAVKPFNTLNDIGNAIEKHAKKHHYSVVEMFGGHGIGIAFHEDPFVFHYKRRDKQMVLVPNMTFTIEPMINAGRKEGKILEDGWTAVTEDNQPSAQWEHTVLVTETGVEVLT